MENTTPTPLRLLRLPEVIRATGLSRTSIYERMQAGQFPRAIPLTASARAWAESEILQWIADRIAARDDGRAA